MEGVGYTNCPKCGGLDYNPGMVPRPCATCAAKALGRYPRGLVPKGQACSHCRRVPTYACPDRCNAAPAHKQGAPIGSKTAKEVVEEIRYSLNHRDKRRS